MDRKEWSTGIENPLVERQGDWLSCLRSAGGKSPPKKEEVGTFQKAQCSYQILDFLFSSASCQVWRSLSPLTCRVSSLGFKIWFSSEKSAKPPLIWMVLLCILAFKHQHFKSGPASHMLHNIKKDRKPNGFYIPFLQSGKTVACVTPSLGKVFCVGRAATAFWSWGRNFYNSL